MDLILALLDTTRAIGDAGLAARARGLTLDWSRFKYFGPVVEADTLAELLELAAGTGRRFCLVQAYGHVLAEVWRPAGSQPGGALGALERFAARGEAFVAAGPARPDGTLDPRCLLVDLPAWRAAGRPPLERLGGGVLPLPAGFLEASLHLQPERPAAGRRLRELLEAGLDGFQEEREEAFEPGARRFLTQVRRLTAELPRGVFVWNLEPYDDVEQCARDGAGPLDALYSVAAGLKPNRLLETHGFHRATRVVYFDYSEPGLRYRRHLLEGWDGRDYPSFLRRLFKLLPPGEAFYCLWDGASPDDVDWDAMGARWREELDRWGGPRELAGHWRRYRELPHEFVRCDLLAGRWPLLARLQRPGRAAIWWSNAFFSYVSNWRHVASARRRLYASFLDELAAAAPDLWLFGASSDNVAVNGVGAREYRDWYRREGGDELQPGALQRCQIAF